MPRGCCSLFTRAVQVAFLGGECMSKFQFSWQMVVVFCAVIAGAIVAMLSGEEAMGSALLAGGLGLLFPQPVRKAEE